ncbi:GNAT family N-acetyltransferase [Ruania halotolerans]|uniref:GNAT family N-acetyltransferase n=1 Tax=Ruania halotolerans TaxID=2897773 RepID=UPI001E43727B|nr:GNAT family N-acetyltransferase [Ruania halotolerans]UFU06040.1 GNAT family N-acetyltransferase [Ruania halotolerans]
MALRWSTLDPESVTAWAELTNLLARVDGTEEFYDAEDLAEELTEHGFSPASDSLAVWAGEMLVAYAQLRVPTSLTHAEGYARVSIGGGVHPDYRGQGIASEMFDRMEPRGEALAQERHPGAPIQLRASGGVESDPVRPLLTERGYEPVRYFTAMERPLPGADLPALDSRVVPFTPDLAEATRLAHNDAFASHWGSGPVTPEHWRQMREGRSFRTAFSRVALAEDGEVLAYTTAQQWVDRELYIGLVGTRTAARGRGLARAVLNASLVAAADSGEFDLVELEVDSANPQGAGALYASLGFEPVRTTAVFARLLPR